MVRDQIPVQCTIDVCCCIMIDNLLSTAATECAASLPVSAKHALAPHPHYCNIDRTLTATSKPRQRPRCTLLNAPSPITCRYAEGDKGEAGAQSGETCRSLEAMPREGGRVHREGGRVQREGGRVHRERGGRATVGPTPKPKHRRGSLYA